MEDTKKWYASRGVWGGIIAAAASVFGIFGVVVSPEQQIEVVNSLLLIAPLIASGIGSVVSLFGRLKATSKIEK